MNAQPVDFHCHLDLHPDMQDAYDRCEILRCTTFAVTTTPKAFARNRDLAIRTKHVHAALGLHPQLVAKRGQEIDLFERLAPTTRFIGEIGLDAGRQHYASFEQQKRIFDRALRICAHLGQKIISVHSVRCARQVLDAISRSSVHKSCQIVLHWFSARAAEIERAIDIGCWFSVNEKMLRTASGESLLLRVPMDRLLTETDAPFIEAESSFVHAGDVAGVVSIVSDVLDISIHDVRRMIAANAERILS